MILVEAKTTVDDLYKSIIRSQSLVVYSGYNGKLLCKNYDPNKKAHKEIAHRLVTSVWAGIQKYHKTYPNDDTIYPVLCCYVLGDEEYNKEQKLKVEGA